jgi:hypothetical protein
MRIAPLAILLLFAVQPGVGDAQTLTAESAVTGGYSTEQQTSAAAAQVRFFGDVTRTVRFFVETAWGATSDRTVDAFGSAYPYGNRVEVIEAYADWIVRQDERLLAVKAGRFRTPFGISSGSDHGYGGFLRAPLIRYGGYFALSNNFLEHGVNVMAGVPRLTVEASAGVPADVGADRRRPSLDATVRVQQYTGSLIVGASYLDTAPYQPRRFAAGRTRFGGADIRWMGGGLQLRGEFLHGRPFDGTKTTGWYADALLHRVGMGPVTAVARVERLVYQARPPRDMQAARGTLGARIRIVNGFAVHANYLHHTGELAEKTANAFDFGISYSVRVD